MRKDILVVMTAILVLTVATLAVAADPHVGTWKMNVAKSKFNPGSPPKNETIKFQSIDNGFKALVDGMEADGKPFHMEWSGKYDGKDYPFTGSDAMDSLATRKIDSNSFDQTVKKGGKEVGTGREVFSKDGKTFTHTYEMKNAQGQATKVTEVYDKQ